MTRPNCDRPQACEAKGSGHCRRCNCRVRLEAINADPVITAKRIAASRAKNAARLKALNADSEFAAKRIAASRAKNADPEVAARLKALNADPEFAAKRIAGMKAKRKARPIWWEDEEDAC